MITTFSNSYINIIPIILLLVAIVISIRGIVLAVQSSKELSMKIKDLKPKPPRIKVYFPGNVTTLQYKSDEMCQIPIHFKNIGENVIIGGDLCIYVPNLITFIQLDYLGETKTKPLPTTSGHKFQNTNYLFTGKIFDLSHDETSEVKLHVKMPSKTGVYILNIHFTAGQNEDKYHELNLSII